MVVRRWRAGLLADGVSPTMVAKAYRLMRAVLNTAVDDDIIDRNPCRIRGASDEKAPERQTLNPRQVQQLCMAVPSRFSALIAVTTYGSLRWGEVTALSRRDIDLDSASARYEPRSSSVRTAPWNSGRPIEGGTTPHRFAAAGHRTAPSPPGRLRR